MPIKNWQEDKPLISGPSVTHYDQQLVCNDKNKQKNLENEIKLDSDPNLHDKITYEENFQGKFFSWKRLCAYSGPAWLMSIAYFRSRKY